MYIFMATFIGLIMNSKCQQTLNTHIGLAYFIDARYFEHYGLQPKQLINFSDVYEKLVQDFYEFSCYQPDQL